MTGPKPPKKEYMKMDKMESKFDKKEPKEMIKMEKKIVRDKAPQTKTEKMPVAKGDSDKRPKRA